ncbi:MAG TPA: L,D-transpeptidase family protein [Gemmatimonadales bacterium]|nr:L,D-transpeptidase family protein [Gemmatimonadales bacterium]
MTRVRATLCAAALFLVAAPARAQDPASFFLRAAIDQGSLPLSRYPDFTTLRPFLDSLYRARGDEPVWDRRDGYGEIAHAAVVALRASAERGLLPRDYDVALLDSIAEAGPDPDPFRRSERDLLLTLAVFRYLRDLRDGRIAVTPFVRLKTEVPIPTDVALLTRAAAGTPIEQLAQEVEPHLAQYRNLLAQLGVYRKLVDTFRLRPLAAGVVRPGARYAGTRELRRRLVALRDLPADAPQAGGRYDTVLVEGVKRFQARHGLIADGVLGAGTRAALNTSPATRVRQIVLALERLRWLPPLDGPRLLVVNIPAFELFAFDSIGGMGTPVLRMPVVIGDSFDHRTPVMLQPLQTVQFRPFWNVPRTILLKEILPLVRADSLYLRKARMEVVVRDSAIGDTVNAVILRRLEQGRYRVRQRPGPWNALGLTKFSFPNRADIYLHGTPDTLAFRRARRDLSHGCIRVRDPAGLAEWVLQGANGWTRPAIDSARAGTADTIRAEVTIPTSVLIFYTTAVASPDGQIWFYNDIYGHDRPLQAALARRR